MKHVTDTKAAKSISAWVILNRRGESVANVQAHWSDSGVCLVNVRSYPDGGELQVGRASGYGYDKLTAALTGLVIDGHKLSDHCGESKKMPKGGFPRNRKAPKGWHYANYSSEINAYTSCYRESGLSYLSAIGYRVYQAI